MRILDFRTGKMTKLALDFGYIPAMAIPGVLYGIGGAGLGSLIDRLAGTKRRWTTILGLLGLAGGAGAGGLLRYLDERSNTPEAQMRRFLTNATAPPSDQFVQQMSETFPYIVETFRKAATEKKPSDLIRGLIWPLYEEGGIWLYNPSASEFQLILYFASKTRNHEMILPAIDLATDIAAQGRLLSRYQEWIPENLRPEIENHFRNYVNATIDYVEGKTPDPNAPKLYLDKLVKLLKDTNKKELIEIADLIRQPRKVLQQQ